MLSIDNFDFELFGRVIFTIIMFGIMFGITTKICNTIEAYIDYRKSQKDKPVDPDTDDSDFFFGAVDDWRKMK